jgi:hypothetical protein
LNGANTYSGGTNANFGIIAIGNNAALGTGVLNLTDLRSSLQAAQEPLQIMLCSLEVQASRAQMILQSMVLSPTQVEIQTLSIDNTGNTTLAGSVFLSE